jgi:hypothetical protein
LKVGGEFPYLCRRRYNKISITTSATPATAPIVIPAICPPVRPDPPLEPDAPDDDVLVDEETAVVVNIGGKEVTVGKSTFSHRVSALEL